MNLEIFAFMVIEPIDLMVFQTGDAEEASLANYLTFVRANAKNLRNLEFADDDRTVTLSTCSYEFTNARGILVAKILN